MTVGVDDHIDEVGLRTVASTVREECVERFATP
jgi:hypothetical protein